MSKTHSSVCRPDQNVMTHPLAENTTVVLLGWAGARESHLAKYAELYRDRGFTTLRFTADFDGRHPLYLKSGRDISGMFPQLDDVMDERPNLLFHTYSMNGVFALCALMKRTGYEDILKRTLGIVMDSGPVYFDDVSGYREVLDVIFTERTLGGTIAEKAVSLLFKEALTAHMHITYWRAKLLMRWFGARKEDLDPFTFLKKHPDMPRHQLYLYSQRDTICKAYMIEEFVAAQRALGNVVDFVDFVDSEHVAHLRTYPKEYSTAVDNFMDKIVRERKIHTDFVQSRL